jgi:GTPase SAR1 family protein
MSEERKSNCDFTSYFKVEAPSLPIEKEQYTFIHPPIPKIGARILLIGASGTGKTNIFRNLITRYWISPETGESIFDIVLVFSPTIEQDSLYELMFSDSVLKDRMIPKQDIDTELLTKILNRKEDNLKICIFIDDFAYQKKVFEMDEIRALFFRGRHAGLTVCASSQFFFSIDPAIRVNATHIFIFRLKRANEQTLLRLQLSTPKIHDEIFDECLKEAHEGSKYNFLLVDLVNQRFYKNFDYELLNPEGETSEEEVKQETPPPSQPQEDEIDKIIQEQINILKPVKI